MGKQAGDQRHKAAYLNVEAQHEEIFSKIKTLKKSIKKVQGERTVFHKLFSLARYAEKHFEEEESLMFLSGYRKYPEHKKRHGEFIRKIGEIKESYNKDHASASLPAEVQETLGKWLKDHIAQEDAEVTAWLNDKTRTNRSIMH